MRCQLIHPAIRLVLAVVMTTSACLVGCAPVAPSAESTASTDPQSSIDTTIGPVGLDQTVTVGPYEIAILKAQVLADPKPGPDMAGVPPIPEGFRLAHFRVAVHNPSPSSETTMPSLETFGLFDEGGDQLQVTGTGLSRSEPTGTGNPYSSGTGAMTGTPVRPGETIWLEPQFLVPEGARELTLTYAPLDGRPNLVVEFVLD